jgi:hypothetical protein
VVTETPETAVAKPLWRPNTDHSDWILIELLVDTSVEEILEEALDAEEERVAEEDDALSLRCMTDFLTTIIMFVSLYYSDEYHLALAYLKMIVDTMSLPACYVIYHCSRSSLTQEY